MPHHSKKRTCNIGLRIAIIPEDTNRLGVTPHQAVGQWIQVGIYTRKDPMVVCTLDTAAHGWHGTFYNLFYYSGNHVGGEIHSEDPEVHFGCAFWLASPFLVSIFHHMAASSSSLSCAFAIFVEEELLQTPPPAPPTPRHT